MPISHQKTKRKKKRANKTIKRLQKGGKYSIVDKVASDIISNVDPNRLAKAAVENADVIEAGLNRAVKSKLGKDIASEIGNNLLKDPDIKNAAKGIGNFLSNPNVQNGIGNGLNALGNIANAASKGFRCASKPPPPPYPIAIEAPPPSGPPTMADIETSEIINTNKFKMNGVLEIEAFASKQIKRVPIIELEPYMSKYVCEKIAEDALERIRTIATDAFA